MRSLPARDSEAKSRTMLAAEQSGASAFLPMDYKSRSKLRYPLLPAIARLEVLLRRCGLQSKVARRAP